VASIVAVPKVANTVERVKPAGVRSIRNQRNGLTSASVRVNWRGEDQGSLRWKEMLKTWREEGGSTYNSKCDAYEGANASDNLVPLSAVQPSSWPLLCAINPG
jgi:hypothetical protein